MKILIDMQGLQTPFSARRGVGTYVDGLVREINDLATEHDVEYLFNAEFPEEYFNCQHRYSDFISPANSHIFSQQILENYHSGTEQRMIAAEAFISSFIESIEPDVLFSPNLQEGLHDRAVTCFAAGARRFVQIATLHDMVPMHLEDEYLSDPGTRRWYIRKVLDAKRCDRIVTVSENSKSEIIRFVGLDASKIAVIPNGFNSRRYNPQSTKGDFEAVQSVIGARRDYVLYVGAADKHKNIVRLVEAYASLPPDLRKQHALVLAGGGFMKASEVLNAVERNALKKDVIFTGFVADSDLPAIIRQAALFVFPSTHEGFGLPPLEAMACGTATIGSKTSAVGEVLADPNATFDPLDVADMAQLMSKALRDKSFRESLQTKGLKRASDFSWRKSARKMLAVMTEEHDRRVNATSFSFVSRRLSSVLGDSPADTIAATAITVAETLPDEGQPRLFVDVSSVAQFGGNSGIQRVARKIAANLSQPLRKYGSAVEVVYVEEGSMDFRILHSFSTDGTFVPNKNIDQIVDFSKGDKLLFLDLHPGLAIRMEHNSQRLRVLGVKIYHVVYDILPVLKPEKFWPDLVREFYRWLECISRSDGLACISRTVADEVAAYLSRFGVRRPDILPIGHFHLGSDFTQPSSETRTSGDIEKLAELSGREPKFLMVGTLEPRKAHEQTILAFEQAWSAGKRWRLVIAGKLGWNMDRLGKYIREHPQFGRRLFWFEGPSDQMLHSLYDRADCVICASEGEGFGLPLIEAANAGKPVIARDIPVFREVAGTAACYFPDDRSPSTIRRAVEAWLARRVDRSRGTSSRIKPLKWSASARELAMLLNEDKWDSGIRPAGAVDLNQTVTLSTFNVGRAGFFDREHDFIWTGANASVRFETDRPFDKVSVDLEYFSWKRMPFRILIDGEQIFEGVATGSAKALHLVVPSLASGEHRLEFRSDAADRPVNDRRVLGIAVKELMIAAQTPIKIGQWIGVRAPNVQWDSFSPVEYDWRWTVGERAAVQFEVAEGCSAAVISLFARAAGPWNATFLLNGKQIHSRQLSMELGTLELPPAEIVEGSNRLDILLESVRPFSNDDQRLLGLRLLEFSVSPCADAETRDRPLGRVQQCGGLVD